MNQFSKSSSSSRAAAAALALAAACAGGNVWAQGAARDKQDWMTATLSASKDGRDAASVQSQLQKIVESAMTTLRNDAQGRQMELSTGNFSISPRYGNNGKIEGWQGQAEIVLQGRDFVRITQAAAKVQDMTLASMSFGLSREAREKVEGEAQAKAIESFRQRAAAISKSFGFAGYSLREVNVSSSGGGGHPMPRPRMMSMAKASYADAAPVPVEADRTEVTVSVGGSIQMQ